MYSKRNFNEDWSSEEDESRRKKSRSTSSQSPPSQSFRICSSAFVDSSNRGERKMVKIPLDILLTKSEKEIRDILITELPQLQGISFALFVKDDTGTRYFCPCSFHCTKDHSAEEVKEWNGKNIRHVAPGNRAVWILIEGVTRVPSTGENIIPESGYETNVTESSTIAPSVDPSFRLDLDLDLQDEGVTEVPSTSKHIVPERHFERCCETNLTESRTMAPSVEGLDPSFSLDLTDEELHEYRIDSPAAPSTPTLLMEIIASKDLFPQPTDQIPDVQDAEAEETYQGATQGSQHPRIVIKEIVPKEGDVAGGDTFILILTESCMVNDVKVQFGGIDPISVGRIGVKHFEGIVPPSPTPGEVEVQFLNLSGESITEKTTPFTYTTENAIKKVDVKQDIQKMNMDDLQETLIEIANRMGQMSLSKEETSQPGGVKTQALTLLRMIVDTAAKINAMDFFRILFRTHVGRSVFKSFKDEQPLLEEIARGNGHEELACFLEQKHLMYRDDENESDDEVDWKALAKAIEKYQTLNGETAEKKSIKSTSTGLSELKCGYLGDAESSTSRSSLQVSVGEECFEDTFDEQLTTQRSECREEPDTCSARGSAAVLECSLPSPAVPVVGRNLECEQILANLTLNHRRIGVIYGAQGIGKTTVAVQVGHMLHSKGWHVHYHHCRDQDASLEISTLLQTQPISGISHFTLFILDNVDIYIESDGQDKISSAFQSFVESATENGFVGLLFVIRKGMHVLEKLSFSLNLQPLNSNFAVEILKTASGNIPVGGLKTIAEACDHIPRNLMIARGLIQDGMSETDIINKFRKDKAHKLEDCHSSSYSDLLHLPGRGQVIGNNYPMFAPKEVASLRKKLESFDAGNWEHFHPDTDQPIYSLMQGSDGITPPVWNSFDLELTDDFEWIQPGSEHLETAEGEFCGQKSKDARAMKSLVLPSFRSPRCCLEDVCVPRNDKTESIRLYSSMPCVTVEPISEGIASKNLLQKGQKAVTQTSEESVPYVCINEPSSESGSRRHSRPFAYQFDANQKERKSVCLPLARKKVRLAILLGLLTVVCFVGIAFIAQAITKNKKTTATTTTTTTTATTMTSTTREACSYGPSTLRCEAARNVTSVVYIEWKVKVPGIEWITFSHCHNQLGRCVVTRPMLTKGIKVLNSSLDTVTLQRIAENKTNDHARIMCQVHYSNYPLKVNIYEINFSATCVWIPKGRDLYFTRILLNMLSCKRVVDIDLFNVNGSRFAHCNSCQGCTKTNSTEGNHLVPVFWNRLRVKRGSLLLTDIQENDDGRTIKVKVQMQTPRTDNGTIMDYTLRIFVNSSRGSPEKENKTLSLVPAKPINPCTENQFWVYNKDGSTLCVSCGTCPPGQTLSPECGTLIPASAMLKCVPCPDGVSFSSKYDTLSCIPCSSCLKDQVVLLNCSSQWDIKCAKRCYSKDRYYDDDKGDCFTCSRCCGDDQDVVEDECKGKLGAGSNMICSFHSSVNRCEKPTTSPQTPTTLINLTRVRVILASQGSKREHIGPPTTQSTRSLHLSQRKDQDLLAALSILVVILVLLVCCVFFFFYFFRKRKRRNRYSVTEEPHSLDKIAIKGDEDRVTFAKADTFYRPETFSLPESIEPLLKEDDPEIPRCSCEIAAEGDSKLLSSLLQHESDDVQKIYDRLDTKMPGVGHYRAVALHYGLDIYQIGSRLDKHVEGPSRALIEWLATAKPELTVREFVTVVREEAKRNDVAKLLGKYDAN